jgi:hypothetical protein
MKIRTLVSALTDFEFTRDDIDSFIRECGDDPDDDVFAASAKSKEHCPPHETNKQCTTDAQMLFESFWAAYPRKVGKGAAKKAWAKIRPSRTMVGQMIAAIHEQQNSVQWQRNNGQYIPHPATWLNQTRWEDEPEIVRDSSCQHTPEDGGNELPF